MSEPTTADRRDAPRYSRPGHVWWTRAGDTLFQHGWVSDRSRRGLAFVTAYARLLQPGQAIEVSRHGGRHARGTNSGDAYVVQRVEPYDERLSLVACKQPSEP